MPRSRSRPLHGKVAQLMWLPTWAWCCQDPEPKINWDEQMSQSGGKKQTQQQNAKEEREREEVKMREEETNQQGEVMKIMCVLNTESAIASGKSAFRIAKILSIRRFPVKSG